MDTIIPIESADEIDGMVAEAGIISPVGVDDYIEQRPDWPETFFLWKHSLASMTFESPSTKLAKDRVAILKLGVDTVLNHLANKH